MVMSMVMSMVMVCVWRSLRRAWSWGNSAWRCLAGQQNPTGFLHLFRQVFGNLGMIVVNVSDQRRQESRRLQSASRNLCDECECFVDDVNGHLGIKGGLALLL